MKEGDKVKVVPKDNYLTDKERIASLIFSGL